MWKKLVVLSLFGAMEVQAYAAKDDAYTARDICDRISITMEEMVFSADGKILKHRGKVHTSRPNPLRGGSDGKAPAKFADAVCGFSSGIGSRDSSYTGPLYLLSEWMIKADGSIHYRIEQFAKQTIERNAPPKFSDSVKVEEGEVEDFAPIMFVSPLHKAERLVVRVSPVLLSEQAISTQNGLPIVGRGIVAFDNKQQVLADNIEVGGKFVGFSTLQGFLGISYTKFKGAEPIGVAVGNRVYLKLPGERRITLVSAEPFVPMEVKAQVYGIFDPNHTSGDIRSQSVTTTDDEAEFLEKLKRIGSR